MPSPSEKNRGLGIMVAEGRFRRHPSQPKQWHLACEDILTLGLKGYWALVHKSLSSGFRQLGVYLNPEEPTFLGFLIMISLEKSLKG